MDSKAALMISALLLLSVMFICLGRGIEARTLQRGPKPSVKRSNQNKTIALFLPLLLRAAAFNNVRAIKPPSALTGKANAVLNVLKML